MEVVPDIAIVNVNMRRRLRGKIRNLLDHTATIRPRPTIIVTVVVTATPACPRRRIHMEVEGI